MFSAEEKTSGAKALKKEIGTHDASYDRRITAVLALLEGGSVQDAVKAAVADSAVVWRWIDQYRKKGIDGLKTKGQKRKG